MSYPVGRAGEFFSRKIYTEVEPDAGRSALAFQQPARPAAGEQAGVSNEAMLRSFDFGFEPHDGDGGTSEHGSQSESFDFHFGLAPHDGDGRGHPLSSQATNPAARPSTQDSHSAGSSADWGSRSRLVPPRRPVREASGGLPSIPEEARQSESTALKAKKETPQAPPTATNPTRFAVPERAFADVLTQPFELNSNRLNPVTEFVRAPGRQPIAAAAYGTSATGSANKTLQEGAFGVLAGQRGLSALTYAFNAATSHGKKQRYTKMLDGLLQEDVDKFNGSVAAGKREDEAARARTGVSGLPSRAYPRQDTMILTKDNKGNFAYDMDKVSKAASSKDPKTAETSLHAKDILLADHIANQIAGKQRNRAIYGFAHSATATVGAGIVAAASHGTSVAADGTLRAVGYGVTGASGIDPARLIRGVKRSMREKKALKVKSAELVNRQGFAQESRDGFRVPGVDVRTVDSGTGEIRIADRVPSRTVPVSEVPDKAIKAVSGALQDRAVRSVENNNIFGGVFPGSAVNEEQTELAKKQRREDIAEHAYNIVKQYLGVNDAGKIPGFVSTLQQMQAKPSKADSIFDKLVKKDPEMSKAYQLMRDFGAGDTEARLLIVRTMEVAVEKNIQGDETMARLAGTQGKDFSKIEKDEIIKPMADAGRRR